MATKKRGSKKPMNRSLRAVRWAARQILLDDPEHFVEGCADVAVEIQKFARIVGLPDVDAVYGSAYTRRSGRFPHAWLVVDGLIYDARGELERRRYERYSPDANVAELFGVDEEHAEWQAERLADLWRKSNDLEIESALNDDDAVAQALSEVFDDE